MIILNVRNVISSSSIIILIQWKSCARYTQRLTLAWCCIDIIIISIIIIIIIMIIDIIIATIIFIIIISSSSSSSRSSSSVIISLIRIIIIVIISIIIRSSSSSPPWLVHPPSSPAIDGERHESCCHGAPCRSAAWTCHPWLLPLMIGIYIYIHTHNRYEYVCMHNMVGVLSLRTCWGNAFGFGGKHWQV